MEENGDVVHEVAAEIQGPRECEQALLAALVKGSDDAIISYSTDFRITSWNRGAQKLLGYTAQEALGKRPFDLYVAPADRAMDKARLTRDLALIREDAEATRRLEVPLLRKDGTVLDGMIVGGGIHDANGKLIGLSTIIRDITERKRAEAKAALLAAIVESSDDAITSIAPDLRIIYWNRGAERMFGFTAAESVGQPLTRNIAPESEAQAREIVHRLMERPDEVVRFEGPNHRKDGTLVEVSTACFAIRDSEGKVVAIASIQRDITERIRAERETALLAAIVNASRDAIMNVSAEAKITTWNPAAERVYGYTAAEAVGKGIEIFVPPDEIAETIERTRRVVETGQPEAGNNIRASGTALRPSITSVFFRSTMRPAGSAASPASDAISRRLRKPNASWSRRAKRRSRLRKPSRNSCPACRMRSARR